MVIFCWWRLHWRNPSICPAVRCLRRASIIPRVLGVSLSPSLQRTPFFQHVTLRDERTPNVFTGVTARHDASQSMGSECPLWQCFTFHVICPLSAEDPASSGAPLCARAAHPVAPPFHSVPRLVRTRWASAMSAGLQKRTSGLGGPFPTHGLLLEPVAPRLCGTVSSSEPRPPLCGRHCPPKDDAPPPTPYPYPPRRSLLPDTKVLQGIFQHAW